MGDNGISYPELNYAASLGGPADRDAVDCSKPGAPASLDKDSKPQSGNNPSSGCLVTTMRKRKIPVAFSKFFETNDIKRPVTTVGRNKNIRFGPDGIYRANQNKLKDALKKHEDQLTKDRKHARLKVFMKRRNLDPKDSQSEQAVTDERNCLCPLQSLVLLDSELASSLFYSLFDSLYRREPNDDVKDELAHTAIKLVEHSVACDNAVMSSLLLILIKICKTYPNIDINAVKRVGTKSLNFSKAILLMEELIICKSRDGQQPRKRHDDAHSNRNKEWICLKRLHEAAGKLAGDRRLDRQPKPNAGRVPARRAERRRRRLKHPRGQPRRDVQPAREEAAHQAVPGPDHAVEALLRHLR